jgi:bifunctional NMN adenylyltransferase/nudix hydrolase
MPAVQHDLAVVIGRFEPVHNGHVQLLRAALSAAKHVLVLTGSAERPRSIKNPLTTRERELMLQAVFPSEHAASRLIVAPLRDYLYNDARWAADVQEAVFATLAARAPGASDAEVAIVGHVKDRTSYYLRMFPQWQLIELPFLDGLSASQIRAAWLGDEGAGRDLLLRGFVPEPVFEYLKAFEKTEHFAQLKREFEFIRGYRKSWEAAPYAPTFVTVDAVVLHSAHLLLVERRAEPGRGLWALPGGFVEQDETLLEACLRELREETRLKLPEPVLRGSLKGERVFDHPDRSTRGRTITNAFFFEMPTGELPAIRGGSDTSKARWVPIAQALGMRSVLYEDHFDIVDYFLGRA